MRTFWLGEEADDRAAIDELPFLLVGALDPLRARSDGDRRA